MYSLSHHETGGPISTQQQTFSSTYTFMEWTDGFYENPREDNIRVLCNISALKLILLNSNLPLKRKLITIIMFWLWNFENVDH